jgi:hypothetical protein
MKMTARTLKRMLLVARKHQDFVWLRLDQLHLRAARKAPHAGHPFTFNSERGDNALRILNRSLFALI